MKTTKKNDTDYMMVTAGFRQARPMARVAEKRLRRTLLNSDHRPLRFECVPAAQKRPKSGRDGGAGAFSWLTRLV